MYRSLIVISLLASMLAQAETITYKKGKTLDKKGKEIAALVVFDGDLSALRVRSGKDVIADIPYDSIRKISYEQTARHRVKEGAVVMIASLGVGAAVMLTKTKNHWLYVDYQQDGQEKDVTVKMDKSEYQAMLATVKSQSGKDIEALKPEPKGKDKGSRSRGE